MDLHIGREGAMHIPPECASKTAAEDDMSDSFVRSRTDRADILLVRYDLLHGESTAGLNVHPRQQPGKELNF